MITYFIFLYYKFVLFIFSFLPPTPPNSPTPSLDSNHLIETIVALKFS